MALKSDAAKFIKLTEIFSKGFNSAAAAEDSNVSAIEEVRRKQKIYCLSHFHAIQATSDNF